jgi:NAD(P)H-flavin reductase
VRIEAGQYINLWMPSLTWWSWAQVHPFMVTSWSHSAQETLDILIQARRGFSRELLKHARAASQGSASLRALIIGPHGLSENVDRYESVVLVASGFGVAAVIPYLKKLVYSYNTSTSRTRRVHLVWEIETLGEYHDIK